MPSTFIRNHHLNIIKSEARNIQRCFQDIEDEGVIEAVKGQATDRIIQQFPHLSKEEINIIESLKEVKSSIEVEAFIGSIYRYVESFPNITKQRIKDLFPDNIRMTIPNLTRIDLSRRTYLGWNDPGQKKKYILYHQNGELLPIEGRYIPRALKDYCHFCKQVTTVTFVSFHTNDKSNDNTDYYRAIGHYICLDNQECNKKIMDIRSLERVIEKVKP
ncbi:FusB/FusC family EF-G-binding protein [Alteribacillus iranensis]|uniref:FBP C-terminal treble-clef zinc-finger n=1 Tax=Alteribacillus iranensis TaxID=930128 RepID=A0A1I2E3E0_9BACI|nr:FusB/FusC family EF-G-binding protein [Alteribacillus iranensis]SFE87227.1 FBP C-terminal treble-clef zinc-finger [Alteribacillus iranensis]